MTALVLHAAHRIGTRALKNRWMWGSAAASFVAILAANTPFLANVLAAALTGHFGARRWPQVFALCGGHGSARARYGPALIDDHTPTPPHARFARSHLAQVLGAGPVLWLPAMAALVATHGLQGTLTQMGWFFAKAALLTFGGALAVAVVSFFNFLPSFIFTLAGRPLVEARHGKLAFTAPLSAITAAVVGVVLNLAMFFAYHVFWPRPGWDRCCTEGVRMDVRLPCGRPEARLQVRPRQPSAGHEARARQRGADKVWRQLRRAGLRRWLPPAIN